MFHLSFVVADSLAVDFIIGTRFMSRHVDAIERRRQCVKLHCGYVLPILASNFDGTFANTSPVDKRRDPNDDNELQDQSKTLGDNTFNLANTVWLTKRITIPPMSQMAAPVVSTTAGLVYFKSKAAIPQRHRVRTANGVADIKTNERFAITISNSSKTSKCLPEGTVIAYAKRNPLAIHALPDNASRTLESVLHLPCERTEDADKTEGPQSTQPEPLKNATPEWRTTVNLDHIGEADLQKRVVEMLETHQDM